MAGLSDECWNWIGAKDTEGYGNLYIGKSKYSKAHIFSYIYHYGSIPADMQVHHKCVNTSCVNPNHLQLLTGSENNEKSNSPSAINKRKTYCKYFHPFDEENTIRKNGRRICIACEKERKR
jgi:hypothetical protein